MSAKKEYWHRTIGEDWYNFYPELWNSDYMEKVLTYISSRYQQATVYPEMSNLFKAFKLTNPKSLQVLILGQDPYPDGSATGLAFANFSDTKKISPSLLKIADAVERDVYDGFYLGFDITLEKWAEQGILLLNTSLTFEKFKGGHFNVWEDFIKQLLTRMNDINGLHVCLWGNHAKQFKNRFGKNVYIYEYTHPAYASYNKVDWKCTHFSEINKKITENNGKEEIIKW